MPDKFKIAVCQMDVLDNKNDNIARATRMLRECARKGADIAVLPEMFNCPYNNAKFPEYAEEAECGPTIDAISKTARETGMYIVAGSIPEMNEKQIYNSSFIFNRNGEVIGKHRKMHLFDIDVAGKITFKESDVLSAGSGITVVDTEFCKMGIAICYDMRFPELVRLMALKGARLIVVPAAFNMTTGPAHWEPLIRIRAVDNQVYMVAASPARNEKASYIAYGHSMIVKPWGEILMEAGEDEEIICSEIDLSLVEKVRSELPLLKHRRTDIYDVIEK